MAADHRSNRTVDRNDLDAMTRDFLAKGGRIVQCPPGSSDRVVDKRTSFKRRPKPADDAAPVKAPPAAAAAGGEG